MNQEKEESTEGKKEGWIEKTEAFIDDAAEKIHQSDLYRKADQSVEDATKKIFRKAGKWWGKFNK
jgi:hypothetical protein